MFCKNCGSVVIEGNAFCNECGSKVGMPAQTPPAQQPVHTPPVQQPTNTPPAQQPTNTPPVQQPVHTPPSANYGQPVHTPPPIATAYGATPILASRKKSHTGLWIFLSVLLIVAAALFFIYAKIALLGPKDLGVRYAQKDYNNVIQKLGMHIEADLGNGVTYDNSAILAGDDEATGYITTNIPNSDNSSIIISSKAKSSSAAKSSAVKSSASKSSMSASSALMSSINISSTVKSSMGSSSAINSSLGSSSADISSMLVSNSDEPAAIEIVDLNFEDYNWEFSKYEHKSITISDVEATAFFNEIAPFFWWFKNTQVKIQPDGKIFSSSTVNIKKLKSNLYEDVADKIPFPLPDQVNLYTEGGFAVKDNRISMEPDAIDAGIIPVSSILSTGENLNVFEFYLERFYTTIPEMTIDNAGVKDGQFVFEGTIPTEIKVTPKEQ